MHEGNDFGTPVGTPLGSMSTGTVIFAGFQGGYGNKVEIEYWDGTVSVYGHLSQIASRSADASPPATSSACPATPATRPARTCTSRSTPTAARRSTPPRGCSARACSNRT